MANASYDLHSDVPNYTMQVQIEGQVYSVRLKFEADGFWYLCIFDEADRTLLTPKSPFGRIHGRKVLPVGPWLSIDPDERLSISQFRRLYDHSDGLFGGLLYFTSSQPLQGVMADADTMTLQYLDAATLAAGGL